MNFHVIGLLSYLVYLSLSSKEERDSVKKRERESGKIKERVEEKRARKYFFFGLLNISIRKAIHTKKRILQ